jgi:hypothetical protein
MKKSYLYFLFIAAILLVGCNDENQLVLEPVQLTNSGCNDCPDISITYPRVLEDTQLGNSLNRGVEEEIIALLTFSDTLAVTSVEEAIKSFTNGYAELKKVYPKEAIDWEAQIDARVSFENNKIISIQMDSYLFTGGAHGYASTQFLNFDKEKGIEIDTEAFFKDLLEFRNYVEGKFRKQEKIPNDAPINSTGFMFEQDTFYLPENIGLTSKGILLLYNQYEVASYADGQIELLIPYKEAKNFLAKKIAP